MNKLILSFHPFFQTLAILLTFYVGFLGLQRTRSLHFSQQGILFHRKRHALIGAMALFMLLGGMVGGKLISTLVWQGLVVIHLHYNQPLGNSPLRADRHYYRPLSVF